MINKNFLVILAGLPASGKSIFALALKKQLEKIYTSFKVQIIDPDTIRNSLTGKEFDYKKEDMVREKSRKEIKNALEQGNIVISDDLNYFTSMRHDLKLIAENQRLDFFIIHISTPLEICLIWNKLRENPVPDEVLYKINDKFDNFKKYSWDFPEIQLDLSQTSNLQEKSEELVEIIEKKFKISIKPTIEKSCEIAGPDSNSEKLDSITRKIVGYILQNPKYIPFKKRIIETRKVFIKENLKTSLSESEIEKSFKEFLENRLEIKFSGNLLNQNIMKNKRKE